MMLIKKICAGSSEVDFYFVFAGQALPNHFQPWANKSWAMLLLKVFR
jgi:hypothetical protein